MKVINPIWSTKLQTLAITALLILAGASQLSAQSMLVNQGGSNLCLGVKDGIIANDSPLVLRSCRKGESSQTFSLVGDSMRIGSPGSAFCVAAYDGVKAGSRVGVWQCTPGANGQSHLTQQFSLGVNGGDVKTSGDLCLSVRDAGLSENTPIILWDCRGNANSNQQWKWNAANVSANYPNPTEQQNAQYRNNPCRNPWISYGHIVASGGTDTARGAGDAAACNPELYRNGSWDGFDQLVDAIRLTNNALQTAGISWQILKDKDAQGRAVTTFLLMDGGKQIGSDSFIGMGVGSLIGNDGNSNVPTILSHNGNSIVAAGGGNAAPKFGLQNGARKIIKKSDGGILIIR